LKQKLRENFANVNVTIVDCPDLTQSPFGLKARGICGSQRIVDVGGPGNLFPVIKKTTYKLDEICKTAELESCLAIGPGAGPVHLLGYNTEASLSLFSVWNIHH
uniref:DUF1907 domain-containing protein n=1 Tax=Romanomermis culicivorax TaxID=13658 RepID=A0A915IUI6_ROMCU